MKKTLFAFLILFTSSAFSTGPSVSGGGDAESLKFSMIANRAAMIIRDNQTQFPEIKYEVFIDAIKRIKIKITNEDLMVNGEKKDAINYPAESLIKVNRFAFRSLTSNSMLQIALVVHEYLGILAVDDSNYFISSRIGGILQKENESLFKWSCAAVADCSGTRLRDWINVQGEGNTAGEAWRETIQMGKDRCVDDYEDYTSIKGFYTGKPGKPENLTPATLVNSCVKN